MSVISYSQISSTNKGLFITNVQRDSLYSKLIRWEACEIKVSDLEDVIRRYDSIISISQARHREMLEANTVLKRDNDNFKLDIANFRNIVDSLKEQVIFEEKNGKKKWWNGLLIGLLTGLSTIILTLNL